MDPAMFHQFNVYNIVEEPGRIECNFPALLS